MQAVILEPVYLHDTTSLSYTHLTFVDSVFALQNEGGSSAYHLYGMT